MAWNSTPTGPHSSFAAHSLTELKPQLLADLGHGEQALETAWADYRKHPDRHPTVTRERVRCG